MLKSLLGGPDTQITRSERSQNPDKNCRVASLVASVHYPGSWRTVTKNRNLGTVRKYPNDGWLFDLEPITSPPWTLPSWAYQCLAFTTVHRSLYICSNSKPRLNVYRLPEPLPLHSTVEHLLHSSAIAFLRGVSSPWQFFPFMRCYTMKIRLRKSKML